MISGKELASVEFFRENGRGRERQSNSHKRYEDLLLSERKKRIKTKKWKTRKERN